MLSTLQTASIDVSHRLPYIGVLAFSLLGLVKGIYYFDFTSTLERLSRHLAAISPEHSVCYGPIWELLKKSQVLSYPHQVTTSYETIFVFILCPCFQYGSNSRTLDTPKRSCWSERFMWRMLKPQSTWSAILFDTDPHYRWSFYSFSMLLAKTLFLPHGKARVRERERSPGSSWLAIRFAKTCNINVCQTPHDVKVGQ